VVLSHQTGVRIPVALPLLESRFTLVFPQLLPADQGPGEVLSRPRLAN